MRQDGGCHVEGAAVWLCQTLRSVIANYQALYCTRLAALRVLTTVAHGVVLRHVNATGTSVWASQTEEGFAIVVVCTSQQGWALPIQSPHYRRLGYIVLLCLPY